MYQREVSYSFRSKAHVFWIFSAFIFIITINHSLFLYSSILHSTFASLPSHYHILGECRTYLVLNKVLKNIFQFELTPGLCRVPRKVMMIFSLTRGTLTASCSMDFSLDDALYSDSALYSFSNLCLTSDIT